jgi:hypothetical protein
MSLWFVVPAHGRVELTRICLRQLRQTCNALIDHGIEATAVVVADDENLDTARKLGFGWVNRDNRFLSRRFNDGIQLACDPNINPRPANYVVPCGSDDWVDHRLFLDLPPRDTIAAFQHMSFVSEDGREISPSLVNYPGGCGIRVYRRDVVAGLDYRPADEDRRSGCDTSILVHLRRHWGERLKLDHRDSDPRQIVDFKSAGQQINSYEAVARWRRTPYADHPLEQLATFFPSDAIVQMEAYYSKALVPA